MPESSVQRSFCGLIKMHCKAPTSLLPLFLLVKLIHATSSDSAVCNANHIFNAIHSSMRQWGGSLNHNGMSFFLATVPEGTQLYHGTSDPDFIKGLQWLAFEPEHALIFARPRGGPGGHPPGEANGPPGHGKPDGKGSDAEDMPHRGQGWRHYGLPPKHELGPPPPLPHHEEPHDGPHHRPTQDEDWEHYQLLSGHEHCPQSPSSHEQEPRNGTGRRPPHYEHEPPPPPGREHGPRKGGSHREHGPPPPLPPGHIYRPYPPPPRHDRPYKGPKKFWNTGYQPLPLPDHFEDSSKQGSLSPPDRHDHDQSPESTGLPANHKDLKRNNLSWKRQNQQPLKEPISASDEERVGYLHTYIPKHSLRLLYIDGLSAGKTSNGTLDTQDLLLLNLTAGDIGGPMGGELMRADGLCELAATIWEDKVDGILRLEGGFEIILCDFEKHLERKDVVTVTASGGQGRGPMGSWQYIKAITSRYNGIGGNRVHIDYDSFVSVFAYEGLKGLWDNDVQSDYRMPRLTNVAPSDLHRIRDDVTSLVLYKNWTEESRTDWQAVADNVITRYSSPLHHITTYTPFRENKEELANYLTALLRPFIDDSARNASLEILRCTSQLVAPLPSLSIPPASLTPLAHRALHAVTTRICDSLLTSLSVASSSTARTSFSAVYAEHAVEVVEELVAWLNWTTWKECGSCGDEEVCFVPIWPMGSKEDHNWPKCRGEREVQGRTGYWGFSTGPPPRRGGKNGMENGKNKLLGMRKERR